MTEEKDSDIVPIQIKLERSIRDQFKKKCKDNDIHYAQWVRKKINEYLADEQK